MEKKATMKGAQPEQQADQRIIAGHKSNAKPLDFSFLSIEDIENLKKLGPRSGLRKPIPESDDEEEDKKVSSSNMKSMMLIIPFLCRMSKSSNRLRKNMKKQRKK